MKNEKSASKHFARLRRKAGANLRGKEESFPAPPARDAGKLIPELQVAQIELKMQNDEPRTAQLEIEASRDRYADLSDFAPLGCLTRHLRGLALERNLPAGEPLRETRGPLA